MIYKYEAEARREAEKAACWFVSFLPKEEPRGVFRSAFVRSRIEKGRPRLSDGAREKSVVYAVVNEKNYETAIGRVKDLYGAGEVLAASPKPVGFVPKAWR